MKDEVIGILGDPKRPVRTYYRLTVTEVNVAEEDGTEYKSISKEEQEQRGDGRTYEYVPARKIAEAESEVLKMVLDRIPHMNLETAPGASPFPAPPYDPYALDDGPATYADKHG